MIPEERILAVDYGEKRVGIAVTDPLAVFATGLKTLTVDENLVPALRAIVATYHVGRIVVGWPLTLKGEAGEAAVRVQKFAEILKREIGVPVVLWDERYTSVEAVQTIRALGVSRKKRRMKGKIDELSAVHLLQNYLSSRSITNSAE